MKIKTISQVPIRNPKQHFFQRLCIVSSLSIFAGLSGIIPSISFKTSAISFDNQAFAQSTTLIAQAQTFSLETIWRYAKALQEINPIREKHNQQVNQLLKGNRPERVCYQSGIPWEVKQNCDSFGSKMVEILKKHNVLEVYTPISKQVQYDEALERKIQKAGTCQQQGRSLGNCF